MVVFLGWFLILTGIIFFLRPDYFRKRLQKKSLKKAKKTLFFLIAGLSVFLFSAAFKTGSFLSRFLIILGIFGIFKAFFILRARIAEKIVEWFVNLPIVYFRIAAFFQIFLGTLILILRRSG